MPRPAWSFGRMTDYLWPPLADRMRMRSDLFALQRGLAASGVNLSAGFSKWQIVLGNDPHQRVLKTIDLT
jgi:hypothetical protein